MNLPTDLTLEQQFRLQAVKEEVKGLSKEEVQGFLVDVLRQLMVKDNVVKHLLKQS